MIGSSQPRFMKEKTCFTSLIAFYEEMTMVGEGGAVSVIYYDFMGDF